MSLSGGGEGNNLNDNIIERRKYRMKKTSIVFLNHNIATGSNSFKPNSKADSADSTDLHLK